MFVPPRDCSLKLHAVHGPASRFYRRGFTLVETVLAIGIVVFTMLPILGLLPVGMDSQQEAISSTVESQLVQAVSGEISLTDYATVASSYHEPVETFYNEEGALLPSDHGMVYAVKVALKDVSAPADPSLAPATSLCAVIQVTRVNAPSKPRLYTLIIPKG